MAGSNGHLANILSGAPSSSPSPLLLSLLQIRVKKSDPFRFVVGTPNTTRGEDTVRDMLCGCADRCGRYASLDLVLFLDMDIRTRERDLPHTNWENASDVAFAFGFSLFSLDPHHRGNV